MVRPFMEAVPTVYCATPAATAIFNAPKGRRMSWLRIKGMNLTGGQVEMI